jgi:hypothetical protein
MPFAAGQIVRPKQQYLRRTGVLQCMNAKLPAQGWVVSVLAVSPWLPALYFNRNTSADVTTGGGSEQMYQVKIWNMETRAFEDLAYAESELEAGTVSGTAIPVIVHADPTTNEEVANLVRSRT